MERRGPGNTLRNGNKGVEQQDLARRAASVLIASTQAAIEEQRLESVKDAQLPLVDIVIDTILEGVH